MTQHAAAIPSVAAGAAAAPGVLVKPGSVRPDADSIVTHSFPDELAGQSRSELRPGVAVGIVPSPPLVGRGLGIALRRVFPVLLPPERSEIEVAPGAAHRLVAAVV